MKKQMVVPMCLRGAPPRGGGQQFSTLRPIDMPPRDKGGARFAGASRGALVAPPPPLPSGGGGRRRPQAHIVGAAKLLALAAIMLGLSYTAVPLYQIFCQTSGFGGTAVPPQATPAPHQPPPIAWGAGSWEGRSSGGPHGDSGGGLAGTGAPARPRGAGAPPQGATCGGDKPSPGGSGGHVRDPRQGAGAPGGGRTRTAFASTQNVSAPICVDGTSATQQQASQITINFAADVSDRSA